MPLIEEVPPSTRPRGQWMARLPDDASGSLAYIQLTRASCSRLRTPAGMWMNGWRSGGPASSSATVAPPSLRRSASTQPAEPAPTMT